MCKERLLLSGLWRAVRCIETCASIDLPSTTDLRKYMIDKMLQQTSNFAPSRFRMQGSQPSQDLSCPPALPSCLLVNRSRLHCPDPCFDRRDDCIDGSRGLRARNSSAPRSQREGQRSFACNAAHVPAKLEYVLCAACASRQRTSRQSPVAVDVEFPAHERACVKPPSSVTALKMGQSVQV